MSSAEGYAHSKLDRLARNVAFISNLMESKVEFEAVDFPQAKRLGGFRGRAGTAADCARARQVRSAAAL
jgi:hypothetical protein